MTMKKEMNNDSQDSVGEEQPDDTVATLMNLAGPRPDVPVDVENRVHDNVRRQWQKHARRKYDWVSVSEPHQPPTA